MLMTIGEEPYVGVDLQGLEPISFTDADGGSEGEASDVDDDDDEDDDDVCETLSVAHAADEAEALIEFDAVQDDDEVDDTDPQEDAAVEGVGGPVASVGFVIDSSELGHENAVIGKHIIVKLVERPLEEYEYGWYSGIVRSKNASTRNSKNTFLVRFTATDINSVVPSRYNKHKPNTNNRGKKRKKEAEHADVPCDLTPDKRGTSWCLLTSPATT